MPWHQKLVGMTIGPSSRGDPGAWSQDGAMVRPIVAVNPLVAFDNVPLFVDGGEEHTETNSRVPSTYQVPETVNVPAEAHSELRHCRVHTRLGSHGRVELDADLRLGLRPIEQVEPYRLTVRVPPAWDFEPNIKAVGEAEEPRHFPCEVELKRELVIEVQVSLGLDPITEVRPRLANRLVESHRRHLLSL